MNKMHTLAKIALATIGIYFIIRLLSQLPFAIFYFRIKPSWETAASSLLSLLLIAGLIALLFFLFFYKNESLAKKIVGSEQLPEPESQIQWLPVALRLICIASGIYFLSNFIWHSTSIIGTLAAFRTSSQNINGSTYVSSYYPPFNYRSLLPSILMLICGVYLLCGAPHFVRWHVKKILQHCKKQTEMT